MPSITSNNLAIIQGQLGLTAKQQTRLLQYCIDLYDATRRACGYVQHQSPRCAPSYTGWMRSRWEWTQMYEGDFNHRAEQDALFSKYNTSYNVPQRATRVWKAKANEKLLNSDPFISLRAEGREDQSPAIEMVDRYFNEILDEASARFELQKGMEGAGVRGEGVMKITQQVKRIYSIREVQLVMIGGEVLRDTAGRPVFNGPDIWEQDPESANPDQKRLKADKRIRILGEPGLSDVRKMNIANERRGVDIALVPWQDLFIPPTARCIHETDGMFQAYDVDADDLLSRAATNKLTPQAKGWLDMIRNEDNKAKSESGVAQIHRDEDEVDMDKPGKVGLVEAYIRFDADEDRRSEELQVTFDPINNQLVYADYLEVVSPTSKRPFEVLRLMPQPNRWSGIGFYKLLENQHKFVDRQRNRIDGRSGHSGGIMWQRRGAIADAAFGYPLEFNSDHVYTIQDGFEGDKAFGVVARPAMDERVWEMMDKELMSAQLISGTLTPADGEFSGAPSNETATGQNYLAEESDTLNSDSLQWVIKGIKETMAQAATITFGTYDEEKAKDILGEANAQLLTQWLSENSIRNFSRRVKMLMTKSRAQLSLQQNAQVIEQVIPTWEPLPPDVKLRWYDVFLGQLKALDVQEPEKALGDRKAIEEQVKMLSMVPTTPTDENGQPLPPDAAAPAAEAPVPAPVTPALDSPAAAAPGPGVGAAPGPVAPLSSKPGTAGQ